MTRVISGIVCVVRDAAAAADDEIRLRGIESHSTSAPGAVDEAASVGPGTAH